ncbi:MAG: rod shape-determining protein RodA [Candidatus Anammoxibacter sp.]
MNTNIRKFDWLMFPVICLILTTSFYFVWSAADITFARKQLLWIGIGLFVFFSIISLDYTKITKYSYVYYFIALFLLLLVLVFGKKIHGSRRWFSLGIVSIQPSEFMKIAYILALSRYMSYKRDMNRFVGLLTPLILTIIPIAFIAKQPDLGTGLILLPIFCSIFFVAGIRLKHLFILIGIGISSMPLIWLFLLKSYQKGRIIGFLWPDQNRDWGAGYHRLQSLIAVGSGRLFGSGWRNGIQSQRGFIPEQHTDFIFSVISEELGFLGASAVIVLYAIFVICGLGIAINSKDKLGRLIIVGLVTMISTQVLINIGMTLGIAPITGLTLPFMSYGGSSILSSFIALALIINVRMRSKIAFAKEELPYK